MSVFVRVKYKFFPKTSTVQKSVAGNFLLGTFREQLGRFVVYTGQISRLYAGKRNEKYCT